MKHLLSVICFVFISMVQAQAGVNPPLNLGGYTLGKDIASYEDLLDRDSFRRIRYKEAVTEAQIKPTYGFTSGLIAFGLCDKPNKIVRIKLKYKNSSKAFFNELFERYEKRFGEPDEYRGDPFHTVIAWKWSFRDKKLGRISLILQHNTQVQDEKLGNAVKMTLTEQIENEQRCFSKKHLLDKSADAEPLDKISQDALWKLYVPY